MPPDPGTSPQPHRSQGSLRRRSAVASALATALATVLGAAACSAQLDAQPTTTPTTTTQAVRPSAPPAVKPTTAPAPRAVPTVQPPDEADLPFSDPPARTSRVRGTDSSSVALANRVLAELDYPWRQLGWTIRFTGPRAGVQGLTSPSTRTITVFVRPGQSDARLVRVLAHELGHAVDLTYGDAERRAAWLRLRGISARTPWFPCGSCDDFSSGAGDFAEVFAMSVVGRTDFRSRLAPAPSARRLATLAPSFRP